MTTQAEEYEMSKALQDIIAERSRQISIEGWKPKHDDQHDQGEMPAAAACYALEGTFADTDSRFPRHTLPDGLPRAWPWHSSWWKPKDRRSNLVRAAALLLAEIERLDRAALNTSDAAEIVTSRVRDEPECKSAGLVDPPMQVANPAAAPDAEGNENWRCLPWFQLDHIRQQHAITVARGIPLSNADKHLAVVLTELERLREAAANWDALRNCQRMTMLGCAGFHPDSPDFASEYRHLTLNFWTGSPSLDEYIQEHGRDDQDKMGREYLDKFMVKAREAKP